MNANATPFISAIILDYNDLRWLPRLLDSLLPQLAPYRAEVLLVDNGSSDSSAAFVRERYPKVDVITVKQNRGPAAGINRGLDRARGQWIFVLNSDLEFPPGSVVALMTAAQGQPSLGLASPLLIDDDGAPALTYGGEPNEWLWLEQLVGLRLRGRDQAMGEAGVCPTFDGPAVQFVSSLVGACMLVRKDALDHVGPLDEQFRMYLEDTDWSRRFRLAGWDVAMLRAARVIHSGAKAPAALNQTLLHQQGRYFIALDLFARKHYGRRRTSLLLFIVLLINARAALSYWVRTHMPRSVPKAITVEHSDYVRNLGYYRSMVSLMRWLYKVKGHRDEHST